MLPVYRQNSIALGTVHVIRLVFISLISIGRLNMGRDNQIPQPFEDGCGIRYRVAK